MAYDYINQSIQNTKLIEPKNIDSFYNPQELGHTGFGWDGVLYSLGEAQGPPSASWFLEGKGDYRGELNTFPQSGIVLLSKAALTILDGTTSSLNMWMQFLTGDQLALANNFNGLVNGWTPNYLDYSDGVISVICISDEGNTSITSNLVIHLDFTQDKIYADFSV